MRLARPVSARVHPVSRWAQVGYVLVAWVFAVAVAAQVFLAGMSIFAGASSWGTHKSFGDMFGWLTLLLIILAIAGRLPRRFVVLSVLAVLLFGMQYTFIGMSQRTGHGAIAALHPANALVIFWIAVTLAIRSVPYVRHVRESAHAVP